jgi:diguanylate cyclase (GGDEF)-like protein
MLAGSATALALLALVRLATERPTPIDWLIAVLVGTVAITAIHHQRSVRALDAGRRDEAETFARILSGLSRSVSPDAIVTAIVRDLGAVTGADHIVVVRRRADSSRLDATLVSTRPGIADSTTSLPISDLDDPVDGHTAIHMAPVAVPIHTEGDEVRAGVARPVLRAASVVDFAQRAWNRLAVGTAQVTTPLSQPRPGQRTARHDAITTQAVAERIARRVRDVYGLRDTIAAPLATDQGPVGAIVLSRRVAHEWPASTRRILAGAAHEASAALSRAYSHREAEAHASTDALTGLPNRRYFDEFCGLLARRRRAGDAVGVLMVDIDHFKLLNDAHGHAVGDAVLRAVGTAIVSAVREDDVPARFGGEEFVVLLRNPGPAIAADVGERVRAAVRALDLRALGVPHVAGAPAVTVSVGVAVARGDDEAIGALIERADRALYRAKRGGRDRVVAG